MVEFPMITERPVIHINHYDLDAAGCGILVNLMFNVKDQYCQGYGKVRKNLEKAVAENTDNVNTLVITDLNIEPADLKYAMEHFEIIYYYDHHESSEVYLKLAEVTPNFHIVYENKLCATAILYREYLKHGGEKCPEMNDMAAIVNTYDLWKTKNKNWNEAVMLNDLFWKYNYWDFVARFQNGFDELTKSEIEYCLETDTQRKRIISEAIIDDTESGSKIIMVEDGSAVNFISTELEGDVFYILYQNGEDIRVSSRLKDGVDMNLNIPLQRVALKHPDIMLSAGGHAAAAGMTFLPHMTMNSIIDFIHDVIDPEVRNG